MEIFYIGMAVLYAIFNSAFEFLLYFVILLVTLPIVSQMFTLANITKPEGLSIRDLPISPLKGYKEFINDCPNRLSVVLVALIMSIIAAKCISYCCEPAELINDFYISPLNEGQIDTKPAQTDNGLDKLDLDFTELLSHK